MSDIEKRIDEIENITSENDLVELTNELLADVRARIRSDKTKKVPIAELATLGAGVASLLPEFNTIIDISTVEMNGLYRVANAELGDVLKAAKDGSSWGALKTLEGKSKMAKFVPVDGINTINKSIRTPDPSVMMMAVALYSIEKELKEIAEVNKKILSFLEIENESQIEADVESLMNIVTNYKYNWDNELSVASSHKTVIDIRNRARKNMIAYQKKIEGIISSTMKIVAQSKVNSIFADLEKNFKYYRLSLYILSLGSMMEIMLSGNYKEEYIGKVKEELEFLTNRYIDEFQNSSVYLEKIGFVGIESNVVKGIGIAGKAVGKLIGNIPLVEKGPIDEFLQDKGQVLEDTAKNLKLKAVGNFASLSNPNTRAIINKLDDMIQIYNHTKEICFDKENIYLLD